VLVPAHRATNWYCGLALGQVAVAVTVIDAPAFCGDAGAADSDTAVQMVGVSVKLVAAYASSVPRLVALAPGLLASCAHTENWYLPSALPVVVHARLAVVE